MKVTKVCKKKLIKVCENEAYKSMQKWSLRQYAKKKFTKECENEAYEAMWKLYEAEGYESMRW